MGKARLLIVEDDIDIGNMLKIFFAGMDFEVDVAVRGSDALEKTKNVLPHLIVLDIMLPDIDGYEVCRNLRTNMRTSHIPVIFLTQKDERSDKLQGLELGADDYITKPFDIEELKLRVQNAILAASRQTQIDSKGWALLDARVNEFEPFKDVYGFVAGDDVLRFTAMMIGEVVDEIGTTTDFIGHAGGDNFIIITREEKAPLLKARLKERFNKEVQTHYNFIDRQQGFVQAPAADGSTIQMPFMTISVGVVSPSGQSFADIREITELAAEARRQESA